MDIISKKGGRTFWPRLKLFETSKFKLWSNYFIKIQYLTLRFDGVLRIDIISDPKGQ